MLSVRSFEQTVAIAHRGYMKVRCYSVYFTHMSPALVLVDTNVLLFVPLLRTSVRMLFNDHRLGLSRPKET